MKLTSANNLQYKYNNNFKATSPFLDNAIRDVYYAPIKKTIDEASVKGQIVDEKQIKEMYDIYKSMKEKAAQFLKQLPECAEITCKQGSETYWYIKFPFKTIFLVESPYINFKDPLTRTIKSTKFAIVRLLSVDGNDVALKRLKAELEEHIDNHFKEINAYLKNNRDESDFSDYKATIENYLKLIDEVAKLSPKSNFSAENYRAEMQKKADEKIAEVKERMRIKLQKQMDYEQNLKFAKEANQSILDKYPE